MGVVIMATPIQSGFYYPEFIDCINGGQTYQTQKYSYKHSYSRWADEHIFNSKRNISEY